MVLFSTDAVLALPTVRLAEPPAPPHSGGTLSPGLCRLLNAAAIDGPFRAQLLAGPERAASHAALAQDTIGCALPDPELRVPPPRLSPADWGVLRQVTGAATLGELCEALIRASRGLAAPAALPALPPHSLGAYALPPRRLGLANLASSGSPRVDGLGS